MTGRLTALRGEIDDGGVSDDTLRRLRHDPPGPREFRAVADEVVIRCPSRTRFALAEMAVRLVGRDRAFCEAATALVKDARFESADLQALCAAGADLVDGDLLWWHGLFRTEIRDDGCYPEQLLKPHDKLLLHNDRPAVLDYLLEPDRGPRGGNLRSFRYVLDELGGCPPLERRWVRWIRAGEFDLGWPDRGAFELGVELKHGVLRRPDVYRPLLEEALGRWRGLLTSTDARHRRQGVHDVLTLAKHEILLDGRILREVLPAVERTLLPEITEITSVCTEVEYASLYGNRPRQLGATGKAEALLRKLSEASASGAEPA